MYSILRVSDCPYCGIIGFPCFCINKFTYYCFKVNSFWSIINSLPGTTVLFWPLGDVHFLVATTCGRTFLGTDWGWTDWPHTFQGTWNTIKINLCNKLCNKNIISITLKDACWNDRRKKNFSKKEVRNKWTWVVLLII